MPICSLQSRYGGLSIGAPGDEHPAPPLGHVSWHATAASMARGTVRCYRRQEPLTSLAVLTVSRIGTIHSEWLRSTFTRLEFSMTSPTETALTLVVVKSFAIVGSAFATVLFFAFVGTRRR